MNIHAISFSPLYGSLKFNAPFSMKPSILVPKRVSALRPRRKQLIFNPYFPVFEEMKWIGKKRVPSNRRNLGVQATSGGGEYEVFLSFRGDERKRFVDHLYCSLEEVGIRAFRDREEILHGENIGGKIIGAISSSRVCIPILSKGYADSAWCLRELAHMVECSKSTQLVILPIFLDVDPSEVKLYQGCYVEALGRHGVRFDSKTVQQWGDALKQVGKIKGWELEKEVNGYALN